MYIRQAGERRTQCAARLTVHPLGPHPILRHFLARMDFAHLVNASLGRSREGLLDQAQAGGAAEGNALAGTRPFGPPGSSGPSGGSPNRRGVSASGQPRTRVQ